ncbi:FAD-dependent oxidoreductase [Microbacterium sp. RD1]|uniref:FAD-dependent oxidoreductase n=1 Tax=Microbacterium sp. RD1 TaxID=3457313 RepID=UPI003FA547C6
MSENSSPRRSVCIVGAGIAGLTTAIALARRGWKVEILEVSPDGRTAGWGLALTGPSLRALDSLDLAERMLDSGYGMFRIVNWEPTGEEIEISPPPLLGPGSPVMAGISRPDLHRILAAEANRLGVAVTYGSSVARIVQDPDEVRLELEDGSHRRADLVVGADGIRSRVREELGFADPLEYTGQAVWRAQIPRPSWATAINTFALSDRQTGVVPISAESAYVFFTENDASREIIPDELLPARLAAELKPFAGRAAELRDAVRTSPSVIRRLAQTIIVESPWNVGRVVLVGDASHAPSPQMASGAALAIEDGVVLAEELASVPEVEQALQAFTERRFDRCATLVKTSARIAQLEQSARHRESHELIDRCHGLMAQPV